MICDDDQRRALVRAHPSMNGLDYVEVSDDGTTLLAYFIGKLPPDLQTDGPALNRLVRVEGGRRIRNLRVLDVDPHIEPDPRRDDYLIITVDKPGDFSTYTLRLVGVKDIDSRYDHADFSFGVNCPSDLDCAAPEPCPPLQLDEPEINYLAKDYASFRQLILDRLALIMPDWKERHIPDLGITLVELLAYVGDHLSYYQDAVATEAYLDTARQRISVRRHARLVDYFLHEGCNARAWLCLSIFDTDLFELDLNEVSFISIVDTAQMLIGDVLSQKEFRQLPADAYEIFEPILRSKIMLRQAHNEIHFYTWGQRECCLPRGTTSASLLDGWVYVADVPGNDDEDKEDDDEHEHHDDDDHEDKHHHHDGDDDDHEKEHEDQDKRKAQTARYQSRETPKFDKSKLKRILDLRPGDVLIFEEVMGPKTGNPADADLSHRCAVRLIKVTMNEDPVVITSVRIKNTSFSLPTPIVDVEWAPEDALPFALCLSAVASAPGCQYLEDVSVVRGNVILVDHGQAIEPPEEVGTVPLDHSEAQCECDGQPGEVTYTAGRFNPKLNHPNLTHRDALPANASATRLMHQDPHAALPQIQLSETADGQTPPRIWEPRFDLLNSGADDLHFVAEVDNDGLAHLRFGNGELGEQPPANSTFYANYRVGNGVRGNLGAEAISHIVMMKMVSGVNLRVRNPLSAVGGIDPESLAEARLLAPFTFRKQIERAIIANDYAEIAVRESSGALQDAAARLVWTGSWYEAEVALDPFSNKADTADLAQTIDEILEDYRRMGHDLRVEPARYVPLDIELSVCVKAGYLRGHVKAALLERFSNRSMRDGKPGFFHPDRLTFGDDIYLSRIVAEAQVVEGVSSVEVTKLQRLFEASNQEIKNGVLALGPFEVAQIDNDPSFPENGKFSLVMAGGR